ncbi:MAG: hydantoinase/oxoprolinase family protein [Burkholderiales bacterium]|nr:hydantoinase/oxoprolinase family protein [Burkholderiales bacterium]
MNAAYSLAIDIGGTFTDIVVYDHARARSLSHKELTTAEAPHKGVVTGIRRLFKQHEIPYSQVARVVHATTLFTNALIERKGAVTGLITTAGFRDTLEMQREHKYELYDLFIELPRPLVRRALRVEVKERMTVEGTPEVPLDEKALLARAKALREAGVTSVAVVFLHAYANDAHERRAGELLGKHYPDLFVSLSSDVSPQIREFERTSTTVANAYIKPLADSYLALMSREIAGLGISAPLFMMLSNGGLTHIDEAKRVPIQLLESGPAAGALAGAFFGARSNMPDVLAFDMGGTTAKLSIIDKGEPLIAYKFEASRQKRFAEGSGLPLDISTVELIEIGAGGGSIAAIDTLGLLKVGPRSAGAAPGPACYRRGGKDATVTDANLTLGYLEASNFAGGTMKIDPPLAAQAIEPLAKASQLDVPELSWGIHSVVNENMAAAARVHIAERGHQADRFALLVTGGGGPLHGCEVARKLGIKRIICPPDAGVASALGLLMAPARIDRVGTIARRLDLSWAGLEPAFTALEREATSVIEKTLPGGAQTSVARSADMRFAGQGFELVTPLPAGPYTAESEAAIRDAFIATYRQMFGQVPPVAKIEIINIRVAVSAPTGDGRLDTRASRDGGGNALKGKRRAWVPALKAYSDVPVYERFALSAGDAIDGPAIVEEASSTLIVPPGARAVTDASGNIVVELQD